MGMGATGSGAGNGSSGKDRPEADQNRNVRKKTTTYREAGVDIDAGNEVVKRIAGLAKSTFNSRVITNIGAFSGLYSLDMSQMKNPVLVSSTDGVGSKIKVAIAADRHETIGIDLVAMVVNDILALGAKPLFFLDYLGMHKVVPELAEKLIIGIVEGCRQANCALIGGETAELPDFYYPGDYDLAGFGVGVADQNEIVDGSEIAVGDQLIGLPSSGLHSNGYTLVRRLVFDDLGLNVDSPLLSGTVADELLKPTRIYVNTVHVLLRDFKILGIAHITGGGLSENIPRILPRGCQAIIRKDSWTKPAIFPWMQEAGGIAEAEMYRTFNMGIGLVLVTPGKQAPEILERLHAMQEQAVVIGEIQERPADAPPLVMI